jgi:hypothetical protein
MARRFGGGVLKEQVVQALDLFYRLPCPETAVILTAAFPELAPVITQTTDFPLRLGSPGHRGASLEGIDEYLREAESRLAACDTIQGFLALHSSSGEVHVGFHGMRDQAELVGRIRLLGVAPPERRHIRQWLRDAITMELGVWRAVADLVCIHGVHDSSEGFWNAVGAQETAQWYLRAEVLYDLGPVAVDFFALVSAKFQKSPA